MNPVCTCGHLPAAGGEDVMGEQRTPAQQWAVRLRSDCQKPEFDIDGYFDHLHDLADAALSRAEEVNEARFAGEKALRGSILDLKDQIGALNQKIAALECRRFECDRHLRAHLDALESTMEQMDSPAKPALDPVICLSRHLRTGGIVMTGPIHLDMTQFLGEHTMHLSADLRAGVAYVWMLDLDAKKKKLSATCDPESLREWCSMVIAQIDAMEGW